MMASPVIALVIVCAGAAENPFAAFVLDYSPAAGQFTDDPQFNDPADALGAPVGAGIADGNNLTVVTLGGFGGSLTLAFDHTVEDDPLNPFGLDAIVFGNAFWVGGNPNRHWAECAAIEISRDANGNGLADDAWYFIPGSHYSTGQWAEDGFLLPSAIFSASVVVNVPPAPGAESIWGYAEYAPTLLLGDMDADNLNDDESADPAVFYTSPDDPFTVGITPGSGGGDAFDIAWAIDPATGERAGLWGFDFIRLTTAVQSSLGPIGEKSAEIDAVADVAPDSFGDADGDRDIDLWDAAESLTCLGMAGDGCAAFDRAGDGSVDGFDVVEIVQRLTGPRGAS